MRKQYLKVLKDYFKQEINSNFPQFKETKYKSIYLFSSEITYTWQVNESLNCFIILIPGLKGGDEFFIEIGWSTQGHFPQLERPSGSPTQEREEFNKEEFICRLDNLWSSHSFGWKFYELEDINDVANLIEKSQTLISIQEAKNIVIPKIDEAISKLKEFGLPYLSEFVANVINRKPMQ
jgi:hypothetical protein